MDKILIEGLEIKSLIGVYDWERQAPRPLLVDVTLYLDLSKAGSSDAVADTIDYAAVATRIEEVAASSSFELLEALTSALISMLLNEFSIDQVSVKLSKPDILPNAKDVAVEMTRSRKGR
ncbi:dihydroneopterin aldolase [Aliiglaciecola sp. CAU 1673]|uniref:dihydroneopterin aldolase n=1 Tax=Aliiglaciecola sp. CAU 1673 TaxID=3032595 RepID=UPI0023DCB2EA|nr:dihydroneopterin aldolase [Aliiglaciecola sp. CAU 1673]MDF2180065.1 dihydroneopterin aldolase [Aliiglaciecola sp. CAU 1673]